MRSIRDWQKNNPDKVKKAQQKYRRSHRKQTNATRKEWYKKNPGYMKKYARSENDRLQKAYGITVEQRDSMLMAQDGRCLICNKTMTKGRDCHTDHDHISGRVRGLLCCKCNCGLGYFQDNVFIMEKAIAYLKRWM